MIGQAPRLVVCALVLLEARAAFAQQPAPEGVIDLSGSAQVSATDLANACRTPGLRELRLDGAGVDPRGWPYLAAAKDLEVLTLAGARIPGVEPVLEAVRDLPKLRRLDISRLTSGPRALETLVGLPALRELAVSNIDPEAAEVISRIKGLKALTVQRSNPDAAGWAAIGELTLEALTIRDSALRDEDMRFIAGMTSLKELALPEYSLSGTAYAKLARLRELKMLDVSGYIDTQGFPVGGVGQTALQEIAKACTKLESLNINYCDVWDLSCLKQHAGLKRLDAEQLQRPVKVGTIEEMLAGTTALEIASFIGSSFDSEGRFLRALRPLPNLKVLAVGRDSGGWTASLTDLEGQPSLQELHVYGLNYVSTYDKGSTVVSFPKLPNLLRVSFYRCHVADAAIADLSALPMVAKVSLDGCTFTGKRGVGAFTANHSALWLNLVRLDLEDRSLEGIQNLRTLVRLDLSDTKLSGEMLGPVGQIATLRQLSLARCRIVDSDLKRLDGLSSLAELTLAGTQITDRALEHLVRHPEIRALNLADTRITDDAVDQLASLSRLKWLDVTGTRMTGDGIARLAGRLPACKLGKYED